MIDNMVFPPPGRPLRKAAIKEVVREKVRRKGEPLFRRKRAVGTYFLKIVEIEEWKISKSVKRGRSQCKLERAALAGPRCVEIEHKSRFCFSCTRDFGSRESCKVQIGD